MNDTDVLIDGRKYTICGFESDEYLKKIASYINHKFNEFKKKDYYSRLDLDLRNVLLAINIADDYFKAKKQAEIFEQDLQQKDQEMYELKHELIALRMKIEETEKNAQEAQQQKELLEGKVKELNDEIDKLLK